MFLGIGSVATVSAVLSHLRRKEFRKKDMSIFSRQSKLQASFCVAQAQGERASLQDYYCHARIPWEIHPGARSWRLLGIFDGHGGKDCAKFAAQFLPHEVRRMLREKEEKACCYSSQVESYDQLCSIAAPALQQALESLDQLYVKFRAKKSNLDLCGTTASVALLCPDGQHAVLCNIGDSRVACVGDWTVVAHSGHLPWGTPGCVLTHAHRVTDPKEMARIDAAGGFVEYGANGHRVNGVLGVSRAIGYCGIRDFAELVPSLSDSVILRRDPHSPALPGGKGLPGGGGRVSLGVGEGSPWGWGKGLPGKGLGEGLGDLEWSSVDFDDFDELVIIEVNGKVTSGGMV
eukprot:Skav214192  [mRNA]  locus=scaffold2153:16168:18125:+ [translate_table: standard]